jgi:hypothetical protein
LQQPQLAAGVDGPLEVLRLAVVGGDPGGHRGDLPGLRLAEHIAAGCPPRA